LGIKQMKIIFLNGIPINSTVLQNQFQRNKWQPI
jgi:hypothetical protein